MGLDNGIVVKKSRLADKIFKDEKRFYYFTIAQEYEIVYWRKCWNIRTAVRDITGVFFDNDAQIALSIDDIIKLIKYLKNLNKDSWEDGGYSIWTWEEYKDKIKQDIKNLKYLLRYMKKYPELEVWFYDSY